MSTSSVNDILLLVTQNCPHCKALKQSLGALKEKGVIKDFTVINVSDQPEVARQYQVRSVPWLRINGFVFNGAMTEAEIRQWLDYANSANGYRYYFTHLLENNQLSQVISLIRKSPELLPKLLELLTTPDIDVSMKTQIGVSAVIEDLSQTDILANHWPELVNLTKHERANIRADGAYYLSLINRPEVNPVLKSLLEDSNAEVREIAQDALIQRGTRS